MLRSGSFCSMIVVLTEHGQEQTAYIVTSGGGDGLLNSRDGSNRKFAKDCIQQLEACGFTIVKSDIDTKKKGFIERFLE